MANTPTETVLSPHAGEVPSQKSQNLSAPNHWTYPQSAVSY